MGAPAVERRLDALVRSLDSTEDGESLLADVSTRLREIVPFDSAAWFGTDPATVLPTLPVRVENVEAGHCESYWDREFRVEDVLLYRDLTRSPGGAATLYDVTGDNPARSARYREFIAPQGYGDELRAVFKVGDGTWGTVDLLRDARRAAFTAAEVEMVRTVAPAIGAALRTLALADPQQEAPASALGVGDGPGTALFDGATMTLLSLDDRAERLFTELAGPDWRQRPHPMSAVHAVAARARAVLAGRDRGPASARLRATSGRWLVVYASCLRGPDGGPGPTALTVEPAKSAQIAPIIVEAYCLTTREQEVVRAVARGLSNPEIAAELYLSPHTVRDHLKAVFGKVGVSSRGELVAKLFAEHYGPTLHSPDVLARAHSSF
jgi:DNA-binding CsgD family transcriptional regulator